MALVGLEVGSFRPFVPRIQEDEPLGSGPAGGGFDQPPEPVREALWRGAAENARALHVARGVVPVDERTRKSRNAALALLLEDALPHPLVVVEREAGKIVVADSSQGILDAIRKETQGREQSARPARGHVVVG